MRLRNLVQIGGVRQGQVNWNFQLNRCKNCRDPAILQHNLIRRCDFQITEALDFFSPLG